MVSVEQYVKKPIPVEAMRYTYHSWDELSKWMDSHKQAYNLEVNGTLKIFTLEGWQICNPGSWVIRGVGGEFYSCREDIFNITYESYIDTKDDWK